MNITLAHPHGLSTPGEAELLAHPDRFEACGCLLVNVENIGHRVGCRNIPAVYDGPQAYHPGTGISTHPTPLTAMQRVDRYQAQTGKDRLTRKQWRRVKVKQGRAQSRGVA